MMKSRTLFHVLRKSLTLGSRRAQSVQNFIRYLFQLLFFFTCKIVLDYLRRSIRFFLRAFPRVTESDSLFILFKRIYQYIFSSAVLAVIHLFYLALGGLILLLFHFRAGAPAVRRLELGFAFQLFIAREKLYLRVPVNSMLQFHRPVIRAYQRTFQPVRHLRSVGDSRR